MAIEFECPSCDATIRVKDEAAGKKGRCPKCKALLLVPEPEESVEEEIPAAPELPPAPPTVLAPAVVVEAPPEPPVTPVPPPTESEPVPAAPADPGNPFAFTEPSTAPRSTVRRHTKPRRSSGKAVTIAAAVFGLAVVAVGGWLIYRSSIPDLAGRLTGERLRSVSLTPVTVAAPSDTVPKVDIAAVMDVLASEGLPLKSEYISVLLTAMDGEIRVAVDLGPRADAVRVPLGDAPGVKAALARSRDTIMKLKREELRTATADLFRDYAAYLDGGPPMTRLPEYRDQVALNASVGAVGYAVEAVVSGYPFPCVYEDASGNCYFFPPEGTTSFRLRGRTLADGGTPLPVDFEVAIVDAKMPTAPETEKPATEETAPEPMKPEQSDEKPKEETTEASNDSQKPPM